MNHPMRVGLTGGIGSGKSEAARRFMELGVPVIDTDIIARQLVEPGQAALAEIVDAFGDGVVTESGQLDRSRLRQLVFTDPARRKELESILHPRIRERATTRAEQTDAPYCILVIPLLVETADNYQIDRVLVVDTPQELQYQRVAMRDGLADREIAAILSTQASREQRLQAADDILVNDADIESLRAQVDQLHRFYLGLTAGEKNGETAPPTPH